VELFKFALFKTLSELNEVKSKVSDFNTRFSPLLLLPPLLLPSPPPFPDAAVVVVVVDVVDPDVKISFFFSDNDRHLRVAWLRFAVFDDYIATGI